MLWLQATQYKDLLYIVSGEFWGVNETRVPAIYWAILKPTEDICYLTREDQGMVASAEGLSLAYPVIAGRPDGGAVLAYSFSGPTVMAGGRFPAFPGERPSLSRDSSRSVTHMGVCLLSRCSACP